MKPGFIVWLGGFIYVFLWDSRFIQLYAHLYQSASSWWHLAEADML